MDKAVLILDIPANCAECSIRFDDEYSYWCPCKVKENTTDVYEHVKNLTKPRWCPLKPISDKIGDKIMNSMIKGIINSNGTNEEKNRALDSLIDEIEVAKGIVAGKFTYCSKCDDYYLSKSYLREVETIEKKICIYEDPINSGGNDYVDGFVDITYSVCPKGHRHEINRNERTR